MTNHGGFPNTPLDNWTKNDRPLAHLFGVTLEDYSIQDFGSSGTGRSLLLRVQDTIPYLANEAPNMMAHDSCLSIPPSSTTFVSVIEFPSDWTAYDAKAGIKPLPPYNFPPPAYPYFSMLVPGTGGAGSLLVIGNSGWVADYGSPNPACGLISSASNLRFALNCIGYLGGLTRQPLPGQCPSSGNPAPAADEAA